MEAARTEDMTRAEEILLKEPEWTQGNESYLYMEDTYKIWSETIKASPSAAALPLPQPPRRRVHRLPWLRDLLPLRRQSSRPDGKNEGTVQIKNNKKEKTPML